MSALKPVIAFDLDGVIVDSLPGLFKVYCTFLECYGGKPSDEEFNFLNGPSLSEICAYLVTHHELEISIEKAIAHYQALINEMPMSLEACPGVLSFIETLKRLDYEMIIVSSGSQQHISNALNTLGINDFFSTVISGDEVAQSKPSPEIYLKAKSCFPERSLIVIEDSDNGVLAASSAGLFCIHYNPQPGEASQFDDNDSVRRAGNFNDAMAIIDAELFSRVHWKEYAKSYAFGLSTARPIQSLSEASQKWAELTWARACQSNPMLHDSKLLCVDSFRMQGDRLWLDCTFCSYRDFWLSRQTGAPNEYLALREMITPLGVSAITRNHMEQYLFGQRAISVSQFPSCWEFAPSGSVSDAGVRGAENALLQELHEEAAIKASLVSNLSLLGLSFDLETKTYDLNFLIEIDKDEADLRKAEYEQLVWHDAQQLESDSLSKRLVPNSELLYKLFIAS